MPNRQNVAAGAAIVVMIVGGTLWATRERAIPQPAPAPSEGDALIVGVAADATDLLSPVAHTPFDLNLLDMMGVKPLDTSFDCELKFSSALAQTWSWSADGKTLRMELRNDLAWSDGTRVFAADLSLLGQLVTDAEVRSPHGAAYANLVPGAGPRILDATHVEFEFEKLTNPIAMLADVTTLPIVPSHVLSEPTLDRQTLRDHPLNTTSPLSSGPWLLTKWEPEARMTFEPNPHWGGTKPSLRKVIFKVIPRYEDRLLELRNGTIDMMESVQVADVDDLVAEHPDIKLVRRGWRSMEYIGWNEIDPSAPPKADKKVPPHPLFGDPAVRRALSMAINVDPIIHEVLSSPASGEAYARRAVSTITPALCGVHNDAIIPIKFNLDEAKASLAALGWSDSNGDGVLERNGVPFRFTILTSAETARRTEVAALIRTQLRELGVDADFEVLEGAALYDRLRRKDFDAAYTGWAAGLWADPASTWGEDSEFNFFSYRNPKASKLLDAGAEALDPAAARAIWHEFQQVVYDDQPYTFLYWLDEIVAVNARFENTQIDMISPYHHLEEWSVPTTKVKYTE